MRMSKERYPITTLYGLRTKIDPTPDYQRPPAWTRKQKQLLIDTILRGYDVPKMYWQRLVGDTQHDFAVVDGKDFAPYGSFVPENSLWPKMLNLSEIPR